MPTTSYLDELLDPVMEAMTPAAARKIVELRLDTVQQSQIETFRRKANEGTLTPEEDARYKEFVEALDIVSILQAKARRFLNRN